MTQSKLNVDLAHQGQIIWRYTYIYFIGWITLCDLSVSVSKLQLTRMLVWKPY